VPENPVADGVAMRIPYQGECKACGRQILEWRDLEWFRDVGITAATESIGIFCTNPACPEHRPKNGLATVWLWQVKPPKPEPTVRYVDGIRILV